MICEREYYLVDPSSWVWNYWHHCYCITLQAIYIAAYVHICLIELCGFRPKAEAGNVTFKSMHTETGDVVVYKDWFHLWVWPLTDKGEKLHRFFHSWFLSFILVQESCYFQSPYATLIGPSHCLVTKTWLSLIFLLLWGSLIFEAPPCFTPASRTVVKFSWSSWE